MVLTASARARKCQLKKQGLSNDEINTYLLSHGYIQPKQTALEKHTLISSNDKLNDSTPIPPPKAPNDNIKHVLTGFLPPEIAALLPMAKDIPSWLGPLILQHFTNKSQAGVLMEYKRPTFLHAKQHFIIDTILDDANKLIMIEGDRRTGKSTAIFAALHEYVVAHPNRKVRIDLMAGKGEQASRILRDLSNEMLLAEVNNKLLLNITLKHITWKNGAELTAHETTVSDIKGADSDIIWIDELDVAVNEKVIDGKFDEWCAHCEVEKEQWKSDHGDIFRRLGNALYKEFWPKWTRPISNFTNGIYEHDTHTFTTHSPEYYSRVQLPIPYEPGDTPAWNTIKATYGPQLETFERALHATLVGDHRDEALVFVLGPTGSGKGTISQILQKSHGSYCLPWDISDLGESFPLEDLPGIRIALDREMMIGYWNGKVVRYVKDIVTHEGPLRINRKGDPKFLAELDLWFYNFGNQAPTLPAKTDRKALFRRTVIIILGTTQHKDPALKDQVLQETAKIISNICAREYQSLFPPQADMDQYTDAIAALWDHWADPVLRYVKRLFACAEDPFKTLLVDDVVDYVDYFLKKEKINMKYSDLKANITMHLSTMRIHTRTKNKQKIYYNIAVIDEELTQIIKEQTDCDNQEAEAQKEGKVDSWLK